MRLKGTARLGSSADPLSCAGHHPPLRTTNDDRAFIFSPLSASRVSCILSAILDTSETGTCATEVAHANHARQASKVIRQDTIFVKDDKQLYHSIYF
jgi:hypothetical protein